MKKVIWWGLGLMLASGAVGANAQSLRQVAKMRTVSSTVEDRWRESLEAFAAADKLQSPQQGGVLFVGSSSIRLWNGVETAFQSTPVIKRGFGGSRLLDCARYVDRLILPYAPRMVVVYAGDNDLAEGRSPQEVLDSFRDLVARVHEELPDTRIAYVSIKPSPSRAALMEKAVEANRLVAAYTATSPQLDYIDIYSRMLGVDGKPRSDLFADDSLHLNAAGYAVWQSAIAAHLVPPGGAAPATVAVSTAAVPVKVAGP